MFNTIAKPQYDFRHIERILFGAAAADVLMESVRMRLYDHLETPLPASSIAAVIGIPEPATTVLLDLLEGRGLIQKSGQLYGNSPLASEFLVSSSRFYQGDALELQSGNLRRVLADMSNLLRKPGANRDDLTGRFASRGFMHGALQYALRGALQDAVEFVTALPGFSGWRRMCDVGGSHGQYSMSLLDRNPALSTVVSDLPSVCGAIAEMSEGTAYGERFAVAPLDLRSDELRPEGYDLVLVSHVLQIFVADLDAVIRKLASGLAPGGWLVAQCMNPESEDGREFKSSSRFISYLVAGIDHFVPRGKVETAFRNAGLSGFVKGTTGQMRANWILAGRKAG
jgi:2-polyprenyl-3-methyl-5-hydroxy-6-metoxy-1,4-benzoquinol methylase